MVPNPIAPALRILGDPSIAERVLRESVFTLYHTTGLDRVGSSMRTRLTATVHARARRIRRDRDRDRPDTAGIPAVELPALGPLPPLQRHIIELIYLDAMTVGEVAERLGIGMSRALAECRAGMVRLAAAVDLGGALPGYPAAGRPSAIAPSTTRATPIR